MMLYYTGMSPLAYCHTWDRQGLQLYKINNGEAYMAARSAQDAINMLQAGAGSCTEVHLLS